jgi:hypothetical protein
MRRVVATCALLAVVGLVAIVTTYSDASGDEDSYLFIREAGTFDSQQYDAARAHEQRTELLEFTCDQYSDVMAAEHGLSDHVVAREQRRTFLLNRNVSLCVASVEDAVEVSSAMDLVLVANADSADSLVDPCAVKQRTSTTEVAVALEHADYPGVYFHPSRRKAAQPCSLQMEMHSLAHKVIVVQHPMERIAAGFAASPMDAVAFAEAVLHGSIDDPVLTPVWKKCSVCSAAFRPTFVIKREFFLRDFAFFAQKLGLKRDGLSLSEDSSARVSDRAKDFFDRVSKKTIRHLFELYRGDHELFGYDPMPYIGLGIT